ncbi:uncharacterized protein LOC129962055 [Argiope bruennichi]|uniref:uncharacterized protein LOC129962055 n=1 Tax=Argiope bruennichi TaxID=94029 RepID=UPI002495140D|nr:uncharacterized protein LOC129962055 [Argiope bruennichi]
MKGKLSCAVLYFFGLYVMIQGMTLDLQNIQEYYKCWIYAQCFSDGPAAKQFGNCITNNLTPKDLNDTYQSAIKTYGNYNSDTFDGAVKEMCNQNDEKRRETYKNEMNGFFSYKKKICNDPDAQGLCSRLSGFVQCASSLLNRLKQNDQCKVDGPIQNYVSV